MKITFLGTRGNIEAKTRRHLRHTVTIISYKHTRVAIDCGLDWLKLHKKIMPIKAIILTHAHDDHANGLKKGAPCSVYATTESWHVMRNFAIEKKDKKIIKPLRTFKIGSISFKAFDVEHSLRAPAVGYRIKAGTVTIFCVHDLVYIYDRKKALRNVQLYIGDGASIKRPIIRRRGDRLIGHAPISTQLTWCEKENVPRAIFTHCGSQIVKGDTREINKIIKQMGEQKEVDASVAFEGMEVILR